MINQTCAITHSPIFKGEEIVILVPRCFYKRSWDDNYLHQTEVYYGHYDGNDGLVEDASVRGSRKIGEMTPIFILHNVWDAISICILPDTIINGQPFSDLFAQAEAKFAPLWSSLGPELREQLAKVVLFCRAQNIYLFSKQEFPPGHILSISLYDIYDRLIGSQRCRLNYQQKLKDENEGS